MYEHITYEEILKRMLNRIPKGLDKREGSVLYTALAPAAAEMQLMYIEFDTILKEAFADTASREYLIKRAAERGVKPREASKAVLKATATPNTVNIPLGERFSQGLLRYVVTEKIGPGQYKVECEMAGIEGNSQFGMLFPVGNISGLETFILTEVLIPGEAEEDTEEFRKAYFRSFDQQSFGGNRKDYMDKVNAIPGVGAVRVTRAWMGPSTVKLTILDSTYNKATEVLIKKVQEMIDPMQDGSGDGLAPIDHIVTVDTVKEAKIQIRTKITFDNGYSFLALQSQIQEKIEEYLQELRETWGKKSTVVRISQIESKLLMIQGIVDIGGTAINESSQNLDLTDDQIPVWGGVTID